MQTQKNRDGTQEDSQNKTHNNETLGDEERRQLGEERKARMRQIDSEKEVKPEWDEQAIKMNAVLTRAKQALDEEMDSVKKMNQLIAFAKVQTIRDLQIREKAMIAQEMKEDEKAIDNMMEAERIKALVALQAKEQARVDTQKQGALVVTGQIAERERQKKIAVEKLAQEREFVLKQIEQQRVDEEQVLIEKKIAQSHLMDQVMQINAQALAEKEKRKLVDQLENLKLAEYQRLRDLAAKKKEEELLLIASKRETDFNRMRDKQTKSTGYTNQLDALRAKRAIEAAERVAREREKQDREKQLAINKSLAEARVVQQAEKQMRLIEQVLEDKAEFDRLAATQIAEQESSEKNTEKKKLQKQAYVASIRDQIFENEARRKLARSQFVEEGNLIRASLREEKSRLNEIKKSKLNLLTKSKVPLKHSLNLLKFNPQILH